MKKAFTILLAIIICLTLGIAAGFLIALTLPIEWFGSCFEGSCGYAAVLFGILLGLLLAIIGFGIWMFIWINKNKLAENIQTDHYEKSPDLAILWIVLALLNISSLFINFDSSIYFIGLSSILFIICSGFIAYKSKLTPFIVLTMVIPYIGFFVLCAILIPKVWWHLSKTEQDNIN